ncbi:MAG: hypothetical protein ACRD5D_00570 [Candidatus Polarisedimenticolia bacterium]
MPSYGQVPNPDYRRIVRADEPRLRQPIPVLSTPLQNANLVANKVAVTLARAGSGRDNPILEGLGVRVQIDMSPGEVLQGLWLFRDHGNIGANLIAQVAVAGLRATFDFMAGAGGETESGDGATGARKNFVRYQTSGGSVEKDFWIKHYDKDVVTLNGEAALDDTLDPVEVVVPIVDASRPWLDVPVDFFASWNDEFHILHRRSDEDVEAGFLKAYGGAVVVSFFDTSTDDEGVGVQVNPLTQVELRNRRKIQVQNTAGLKEITARFRSKADSSFAVDVPLLIRVVAPPVESCVVPLSERCTDLYLPKDTIIPEGLPGEPSDPEETPVPAEEGAKAEIDLLALTIRGATVGANPLIRVRKLAWVQSATALAGARLVEIGDDVDYIPLVEGSSSPDVDPPFLSAKRFTIVLSVQALEAENVAFLSLMVIDGDHISMPITVPGPEARAIMFMPPGTGGGGPVCSY